MSSPADADPLAVWDYEEAGEQVATGHWSVTDAERARAGRETVAERFAALLPANRSRAAARYTTGGWPEGQDVVRVWRPRDPAGLRSRLRSQLTGAPLAVWGEDDVLHVLWQGEAKEVQLCSGVQPRLWLVEGTTDLWEVSLRIRRLDEAVIDVLVMPLRAGESPFGRPPADQVIWRGPRAPAALPAAEPLRGTIENHELASVPLGEPRKVTVYRPPGTDEHLAFVTDEVIPWATARFGARASGSRSGAGPWIAAGYSNGGAWAIGAAQRRPDVFGAVAAFSAGVVPEEVSRTARSAEIRHYLGAGLLEPGFRRATRDWRDRLAQAGLPVRHEEWAGGHDHLCGNSASRWP